MNEVSASLHWRERQRRQVRTGAKAEHGRDERRDDASREEAPGRRIETGRRQLRPLIRDELAGRNLAISAHAFRSRNRIPAPPPFSGLNFMRVTSKRRATFMFLSSAGSVE